MKTRYKVALSLISIIFLFYIGSIIYVKYFYLSDLDLSKLNFLKKENSFKENEYKSIRPYLNQGTKDLEKKYPWLYDKMDELLMNEDNIEAYTLDSAYFKILDDLNCDGILEIYLLNYQRCGSGGCSYKIYQIDSKNKKLKEIFNFYNDDKSTVIGKADVKNGWKSISVVHCWGAANCYRYIFKFDTKEKYYLLSEKKAWKAK